MLKIRLSIIFFVFIWLIQIPISADKQKPTPSTKPETPENYVIMISVDGMKPEYYTKADQYGLKIPNIRSLCKEGSFAEGSETIYPSLTYPSHTTLVTGVKPSTHGIYSNLIWQGEETIKAEQWNWYSSAIKVPTIWTEANKAGLKTASVGWPVTTGANITYLIPEIWKGKFDTSFKVSMQNATPGLADLVTKSLPEPLPDIFNDVARTQATTEIITKYKPNLTLVHLIELDHTEHFKGIFSEDAFAKLEETDSLIGKIISSVKEAGIFERTTFFVVSDHGFAKIEKEFHPIALLAKENYLKLDKEGKLLEWQALPFGQGGSTAIMMKNPDDKVTEFKIIEMFEKFAAKPNSPISRVVKRAELDKLGANPNASCFLEAAPGYEISVALTKDLTETAKTYKATHGGAPTLSEMHASFIVAGYGIKKGIREPLTKNINVAPTISAILGFTLPTAEGHVIRELLTVPVPRAKAQNGNN